MNDRTAGRANDARPALILGEALVDVIDGRRHLGGCCTNVAVGAARRGAPVALAGGVGTDSDGDWLVDQLRAEGVRLDWFGRDHAWRTPVATVATGPNGEPAFDFAGDRLAPGVAALGRRIGRAVMACDSLFFTSNTLVEPDERGVTAAARGRALLMRRPVLFDPNLRIDRWRSADDAAQAARAFVPGAFLVKANRDEATRLTGEHDPALAAAILIRDGVDAVVITDGANGALLRAADGTVLDVPGVAASPVDTTGAGDALSAALVAAVTLEGATPEVLARALPDAVAASARTTEVWGALTPAGG